MSKSFKHVDEFEFPSSFGFKGSAGQTQVKGYCRGGPTKYAEGGSVKKESLYDKTMRKAREAHAAEQAAKAMPAVSKKSEAKESGTSLEGVVKGRNPFFNAERQKALDGYAKGGKVTPKAAVHKHEAKMHPGEPKTKLAKGGLARFMAARREVSRATPVPARPAHQSSPQPAQDRRVSHPAARGLASRVVGSKRGVPVAPSRPMIEAGSDPLPGARYVNRK